ncbi:hypothetical protein C3B44_02995 [Corynebacterium yudongzhengii]|uniref:Uncharacterized protein n=1 Tax=Corynebacterium yudongzhengii TaxID=2080740 RepID=A0A2U1T4A5_9CORY|nr:hypothetical protein C3B44_02995 [Corynebacterium yudongzhengii]PWC00831.1 hypothetical protein DF222_10650 [Corynebacterium yudongzhengii]
MTLDREVDVADRAASRLLSGDISQLGERVEAVGVLSICAVGVDQASEMRVVIAVVVRFQSADEQATESVKVTLLRLFDDEVIGHDLGTFLR